MAMDNGLDGEIKSFATWLGVWGIGFRVSIATKLPLKMKGIQRGSILAVTVPVPWLKHNNPGSPSI